MKTAAILDEINEIENNFSVSELEYEGFQIWPLIRFRIFNNCYKNHFETTVREFNTPLTGYRTLRQRISDLYWQTRNTLGEYIETGKKLSAYKSNTGFLTGKADVILYGISSHRSLIIGNTYFNKVTDSLALFIPEDKKVLHLESLTRHLSLPFAGYHPTRIVDPALILYHYRQTVSRLFKKKLPELSGYENFSAYLKKNNKNYGISKEALLYECSRISAYAGYFAKLFYSTGAKLVFTDMYYYPKAMAAILAARQLNIPVVDIQHGVQGENHFAYSRWNNLPKNGYSLLPGYFWVWDEPSYQAILSSFRSTHHVPLLAGSPLINLIQNNRLSLPIPEKYIQQIRDSGNVVLVSLGDTLEEECTFLRAAAGLIQHADSKTLWVFRCHPEFIQKNKSDLENILKNLHPGKIIIHEPMEIDLYVLLQHTDLHLTYTSTICVEALPFNVPSIIMGHEGYDYYKPYIESGVFKWADHTNNLISLVAKWLEGDREFPATVSKSTLEIQSDSNLIKKQLDFLLNEALSRR